MATNLLFALLKLFGSSQVDFGCFSNHVFELSYADPYTKKWKDPRSISSCIVLKNNEARDSLKGGFAYKLQDEANSEMNFVFDTSRCQNSLSLMRPIPKFWNLDSLKNSVSIYSSFDSLRYRRVAESIVWYRISEIHPSCEFNVRIFLSGNRFIVYEIECEYPKQTNKSCSELFDGKLR